MAFFYVKSGFGTNTGVASSTTKRTGAFSSMSAGDTYDNIELAYDHNTVADGDYICCSDVHAYTQASNHTISTDDANVTIISVDDSNADQYKAGASEEASLGNLTIVTANPKSVSYYGVSLTAEDDFVISGGTTSRTILQEMTITCGLGFPAAGNQFSSFSDGCYIEMIDVIYTPANAANNKLFLLSGAPYIIWKGGSVASVASKPTVLWDCGANGGARMELDSVDLSNLASGVDLLEPNGTTSDNNILIMKNCLLPASWSYSSERNAGVRVELYNCSDSVRYFSGLYDYCGGYDTEAINVRTGKASINGTDISYEVNTSSNAVKGLVPVRFKLASIQADFSSADQIVKCHIMHDSQGGGAASDITDTEAWIEVHVPKASGPDKQIYSSLNAQPFEATGTDYTNNSETWVTTGVTTAVTQEISITTDDSAHSLAEGIAEVYFCLSVPSIASGDFFVCPEVEVSAA